MSEPDAVTLVGANVQDRRRRKPSRSVPSRSPRSGRIAGHLTDELVDQVNTRAAAAPRGCKTCHGSGSMSSAVTASRSDGALSTNLTGA